MNIVIYWLLKYTWVFVCVCLSVTSKSREDNGSGSAERFLFRIRVQHHYYLSTCIFQSKYTKIIMFEMCFMCKKNTTNFVWIDMVIMDLDVLFNVNAFYDYFSTLYVR